MVLARVMKIEKKKQWNITFNLGIGFGVHNVQQENAQNVFEDNTILHT